MPKKIKSEPVPPIMDVTYNGGAGVVTINYSDTDTSLHFCTSVKRFQKSLDMIIGAKHWATLLPVLGAFAAQSAPAPTVTKPPRPAKTKINRKEFLRRAQGAFVVQPAPVPAAKSSRPVKTKKVKISMKEFLRCD